MRGRNGAGRGERGRVGGDEWDLDLSGGGLVHMMGRERLPVLVTLNLVCALLSTSILEASNNQG